MPPLHILQTGEIGAGKSTVASRTVDLLGISPGGFVTYFTQREQPDRTLWLSPADRCAPGREVAKIIGNRPASIDSALFDSFGAALLRQARESSPLILMDECGRFESQAQLFTAEVLRCLEANCPVLGVVRRLNAPSWLDTLTGHPRAQVIEVDPSNRDRLPEQLAAHFRP
ncbi:MAG: nucleoside-triphosphatase, partial [Oscillospiraceae bacterium]